MTDQPPKCTDCVHLILPNEMCRYGARMAVLPDGLEFGVAHYYAAAARATPTLCEPEGKWFEGKVR